MIQERFDNVNVPTKFGEVPFIFAKETRIVQLLLENGAKGWIDQKLPNRETLLTNDLKDENGKLATVYIEEGADVTLANSFEETPVMLTADPHIICSLIENGANVHEKLKKIRQVLTR